VEESSPVCDNLMTRVVSQVGRRGSISSVLSQERPRNYIPHGRDAVEDATPWLGAEACGFVSRARGTTWKGRITGGEPGLARLYPARAGRRGSDSKGGVGLYLTPIYPALQDDVEARGAGLVASSRRRSYPAKQDSVEGRRTDSSGLPGSFISWSCRTAWK